MGFSCQLLEWEKRYNPAKRWSDGAPPANVYLGFASDLDAHDSFPGTPWLVKPNAPPLLNRRLLARDGCLVVHTREALLVYQGEQSSEVVRAGADRHIAQLQKYEEAPQPEMVDASSPQLLEVLQACGFDLT